jgi:hypothetical protein
VVNLNKNTALLLLAVFTVILVPVELIHELYGHEDTRCAPGTAASLEPHHQHCRILQTDPTVFDIPLAAGLPEGKFVTTRVSPPAPIFRAAGNHHFFQLRAPPLA